MPDTNDRKRKYDGAYQKIRIAVERAFHEIKGNYQKRKTEKKIDIYTRQLRNWTAAMAIVGIATVIVLFFQLRIFKKTDDNLYLTSRAYVFGGAGGRNYKASPVEIGITYANSGKTPGLVRSVEWSLFPESEPRGNKCRTGGFQHSNQDGAVLPPEMGPTTVQVVPGSMVPARWNEPLISCGQIIYCDVFNKKHFSRWTKRIMNPPMWDRDKTVDLSSARDWGDDGDCK